MRVSDAIKMLHQYYDYYGDNDLELVNIKEETDLKIIGFNPYSDGLVLEFEETREN
ncbi:hypothetical protein [Paenibacillus jamilae]|uniref:hypothetical protein n=1 Tax=Paenibacillus jamilae TaxID=114136 RepID=UPI000A815715|nr:hypothetical protein [Paenibacillus jamilae]